MPLNTSGPISLGGSTTGQSVNLELGRSATASVSLGETEVRDLAGVSSGAISLSNLYGASAISNYTIEMVLTGGGGGGGRRAGGGGGAGGVHVVNNITVNLDTTYTITYGAGGAADTSGSNSSAFGYTAIGGGRGGTYQDPGATGGSGGGSRASGYSLTTVAGASGTSGQGNDGGDGQSKYWHVAAGGGGGISGAGVDGDANQSSTYSFVGGDGGDGNRVQWYSNVYNNYGAGGGGGCSRTGATAGSGGQYGGGNGGLGSTSQSTNQGSSGQAYAGAGGGGGGDGGGSTYNGAAGGSALIIIRYNSPNTDLPDTLTGGINRGVYNGYRVIQFTGTGSIRFNS